MTSIDRDIVAEAAAIVDAEFARLSARHLVACTATTLLLIAAAVLMVFGFAHRDPLAYTAGVATFALGLLTAKRLTIDPT